MIFSLGGFKFTSKMNITGFSRSLDAGISFNERISNHSIAVVAKKWEETISISGETLPARAGLKALEPLIKIIKAQKAVLLTSTSENFGKYIVVSITEDRGSFFNTGSFLTQSFTMELRRVADDD